MTHSKAEELAAWMLQAAQGTDYGEVSVVVKVHAGEVRLIERHVKESEIPEPTKAGGAHGNSRAR